MTRNWTTPVLAVWLGCLMLNVSVDAATLAIPPVKARDPNPLTSPRFVVHRVDVADFVPFPDLGITAQTVDAFLGARLAALKLEAQPGTSGFTAPELEEVGRLLNTMGLHNKTGPITAREAEDLAALVREQKTRRGISLVALERLAAELGEFYRQRGLPLAVAYVPVQQLTGDAVTLAVKPGVLEHVDVEGNAYYPKALIEAAFADQIGAPVEHRRIEEALYLVNALPGVETESRFVAGEAVGSSALRMRVRPERRIDGRVRIDNHGNERSGETRALGEIGWYNPSGSGDALTMGGVVANDPESTLYGYGQYERPLGDVRTVGHVRIASDAFDWQNAGTELEGKSVTGELGVRRDLTRSRVASVAIDGALAWQRLELDARMGPSPEDQRIVVASLGASGDRVIDTRQIAIDGRLGVDVGTYLDGEPDDASSFVRVAARGYAWTLVAVPWFATPQRLALRAGGQVATEPLPGTLQQGLGGPAAVSAFDPSLVSVDDGVYAGIELRLAPATSRWGELRLFADAAYGEQKRRFDDDLWAYLADVGVAWHLALPIGLEAELRLSMPVSAKGEDDDIEDDGPRLLWMMSYRPVENR